MRTLVLFPTNRCHRNCLHCFQNKVDLREALPLNLAESILSQAAALGFTTAELTGGEMALHPQLEELFRLIVGHGFDLALTTSGYLFAERVLPLLLQPGIREKLKSACFSLDGARAETHEALRGPGGFQDVLTAASLCRAHHLPFVFKSMITTFNRNELTQMALLATSLGAREQTFNTTIPTARLLEAHAILSPLELEKVSAWIGYSLAPAMKIQIGVSACDTGGHNSCPSISKCAFVDYQGNFILCCDLAYMSAWDGAPTRFGGELLGNLKEISFKEGLRRHFHAAARLSEARLNSLDDWKGRPFSLCYWCYRHFGKLEWLKNYPDSPWAEGVLS
jgi:MoaA/NifB/PqqE/SkfB family radical SAM enzyme